MKLILENWRKYLNEEDEHPTSETGWEFDIPAAGEEESLEYVKPAPEHTWEGSGMGNATVGSLIRLIQTARQAETDMDKKAAYITLTKAVGVETAKWLLGASGPVGATGGAMWAASEILVKLEHDINLREAGKGVDSRDIKQFPILDALDMNPYYADWLDAKKLNLLDDAYEQYLRKISLENPGLLLKDIENMNHYVGRHITQWTKGYITISYNPGEKLTGEPAPSPAGLGGKGE